MPVSTIIIIIIITVLQMCPMCKLVATVDLRANRVLHIGCQSCAMCGSRDDAIVEVLAHRSSNTIDLQE